LLYSWSVYGIISFVLVIGIDVLKCFL